MSEKFDRDDCNASLQLEENQVGFWRFQSMGYNHWILIISGANQRNDEELDIVGPGASKQPKRSKKRIELF